MSVGIADHVLFGLIAVAWPLHAWRTWPRFVRDVTAGEPDARVKGYYETLGIEWVLALACLLSWRVTDRPFADLGLTFPFHTSFWLAAGVTALACAFFVRQIVSFREATDADRAALHEQLEPVLPLLPHTPRERTLFVALSFTAGVCEELLYRGFLIAYFQAFMSLPVAVFASTVLFGLVHAYQGTAGAVKCAMVGLVAALLYVWSGSLVPSMVLHFMIDVQGGLLGYQVVRPRPA